MKDPSCHPLHLSHPTGLALCALLVAALAACGEDRSALSITTSVTVAKVTQETVPVHLDIVGTTKAVRGVDIVARVEGFLWERSFEDGADVKEGELLFVIDPRQYEANLGKAKAQLAKDQAALAYAERNVKRYKPLTERDYTTREAFDNYRTQAAEAAAAVKADRAAIELAELNLSYTAMTAPFDGRIGERLVDIGNVVGAGAGATTKLATLVQLDPIYVYFSPTEHHLPEILRQQSVKPLPVTVVLPDESVHPHAGTVDFIDNQVDAQTATIKMRALLPNPDKTLLPGQYARVQVLLDYNPDAIVAPEQAFSEDQGGFSAYVVGADNKVEMRTVELGAVYEHKRIVTKGLKPGEQVVVGGIQKVRPGMIVKPVLASARETATAEKGATPPRPSPQTEVNPDDSE